VSGHWSFVVVAHRMMFSSLSKQYGNENKQRAKPVTVQNSQREKRDEKTAIATVLSRN